MSIVSIVIVKLIIILFFGYFLYKKNLIDNRVLEFLTSFVINFTLPFLGFYHIVLNLKKENPIFIFKFVILSFIIFFTGLLVGLIFSIKKNYEFRREFISLVSFQNSGYLPLNIIFFLLPAGIKEKFIIYIFLYILGFDIMMWSVGSFFIFKRREEKFKLKSIFTPPIIATILGLFFVYTGINKFLPDLILSTLKMVGDLSFVLSMIILGCWLARINLEGFLKNLFILLEASFLKLIVVPVIFYFIFLKFKIFSEFGFLAILQASMPSAVSLPIIVNFRKANSEFVSQGVFISHILSIFTIPIWLAFYLKFWRF